MADTYSLISSVTVGSGGASSIDFTSIPQTYTDLVLKLSARSNRGLVYDSALINPNNSTSNLTDRYLISYSGSSVASGTDSTGLLTFGVDGNSATSSTFGNAEVYFPNYTSANYKSWSSDGVLENNASDARNGLTASLWSNTAAITSLIIKPQGGTSFLQYSTAYLYGIKNS